MSDTLYERYNTGYDASQGFFGYNWCSQSFTVGNTGMNEDHDVTSVKLCMFRTGLPGMISVSIRIADGNGNPTGPDLTIGTTNGNTLPEYDWMPEWREILLSPYPLLAGTRYAIVMRAVDGNDINKAHICDDATSPAYTGGNAAISYNGGGQWVALLTQDYLFEEYGLSGIQYTLSMATNPSGYGTTDPAEGIHTYPNGSIVQCTAYPGSGNQFVGWTGDYTGMDNPVAITMTSDMALTANFGIIPPDEYILDIVIIGQGSVVKDPDLPSYPAGTVVTLTAVPDTGWLFDGWGGDLTGTTNPTTILMDSDKTVSAYFISEEAGQFGWTDWGISSGYAGIQGMIVGTKFITGTQGGYPDSITANVNNTTVGDVQMKAIIYDGEYVNCSEATPSGCPILVGESDIVIVPSQDYSPITFPFSIQPYLHANKEYFLCVWADNVAVPPSSYTNVKIEAHPTYMICAQHIPGAWPNAPQNFVWYACDGPTVAQIYCDYSIAPPPMFTLDVYVTGSGDVVLDPPGGVYESGTTVQLTATPMTGWIFDHWEGDATGTYPTISIIMNENKSVTAVFIVEPPPTYLLNIIITGQGVVTKEPDQSSYPPGTLVTLTANASSGWYFDRWQGDLTGNENPANIIMDDDKTVEAVFIAREPPPEIPPIVIAVVVGGTIAGIIALLIKKVKKK